MGKQKLRRMLNHLFQSVHVVVSSRYKVHTRIPQLFLLRFYLNKFSYSFIEFTEDLSGELKSCRLRVNELEKEIANFRSSREETKICYQQQLEDYDKLLKNFSILRYIIQYVISRIFFTIHMIKMSLNHLILKYIINFENLLLENICMEIHVELILHGDQCDRKLS